MSKEELIKEFIKDLEEFNCGPGYYEIDILINKWKKRLKS